MLGIYSTRRVIRLKNIKSKLYYTTDLKVEQIQLDKYASKHEYCQKIEDSLIIFLKSYIPRNERSNVLLSVSGGSDSVAMLHLMHKVQQRIFPKLTLEVVNFNHKLRQESDEEVSNFISLYYVSRKCLTLCDSVLCLE